MLASKFIFISPRELAARGLERGETYAQGGSLSRSDAQTMNSSRNSPIYDIIN